MRQSNAILVARGRTTFGAAFVAIAALLAMSSEGHAESVAHPIEVTLSQPIGEFQRLTLSANNAIVGDEETGAYSLGVIRPPTLNIGYQARHWLVLGASLSGGAQWSKTNLSPLLDNGNYFLGLATATANLWRFSWGYPRLRLGVGYYRYDGPWIDGDVKANAIAFSGEAGVHVALSSLVGLESSLSAVEALGRGRLSDDYGARTHVQVSRLWLGLSLGVSVKF